MGFSQSWVAIKGKSQDSILNFMALNPTGEYKEYPESDFVSINLKNGWFLVIANQYGWYLPEGKRSEQKLIAALDQRNQHLSANCELIACDLEEHVMVSRISGWKNGQKIWSIFHDAQKNIEHLSIEGQPPEILVKIQNRFSAEQVNADGQTSEVDFFFEIPIELGKALIGYRHDENFDPSDGQTFAALQSIPNKPVQPSRPLWRKILGM